MKREPIVLSDLETNIGCVYF